MLIQISSCTTSWVAVGAGKLVDEVKAHLDIIGFSMSWILGVLQRYLFDENIPDFLMLLSSQ